MTVSAARLTELLTPVVAETGADLEDVSVSKAGKRSVVRIAVDRDGGIDLDDVADISRVVSDALDELDEQDPAALGDSYVLEVGSPGVDRPLTHPRHWRRNVKRLVTATLGDGSTVSGRLTDADEQRVVLDGREIPYADLVTGSVQVEFARKEEDDA
ncbi:MAG: ribosome maturation factor RimP [Actinobacteria bacterium]|nr:ribosome maturation factor RimP [Actinomycetota bacterium]MCA1720898.1 ribosome maturation factor RimP [Actinomycetota bacterium]